MSDRMIIVGKDGVERYLVEDELVTDLRFDVCACPEGSPSQKNGEQLICLVCAKPITTP